MVVGVLPASFAVRPRRMGLLAASALALLLAGGCHHSRSSMRPVYLSPAPAAVVPAPTATVVPSPAPCTGCGGAAVVPGTPTRGFDGSGAPAAAPVIPMPAPALEPAPAPGVGPVPKSSNAEPEPRLEPGIIPPPDAPELTPPASGTPAGSNTPPPAAKATSLRTRLASLVNDPDDLFQPPKADRNWRYIVIHHSASATGNYATIDRQHRSRLGTDGCGYHFVIGNGSGSPDGQIEVARRWAEQKPGAHCRDAVTGEVNDYGIGICLVGNFDHGGPTPRQLEAVRSLVAYLSARYHISTEHIGAHARFARTPTACPGRDFPIHAILGSRQTAAGRRPREATL